MLLCVYRVNTTGKREVIADGVQHFHTFHRENKTVSDAEAKKEAKAKTSSHEQIRAFAEEVRAQMDASMILSIIGIALACYSLGYSVRGLAESSRKRNNQRSDTDKNGSC